MAGVALGIGTLLWASGGPEGDPTVRDPLAGQGAPLDDVDQFDTPALADPNAAPPAEPAPGTEPAPAPPASAPPASAPPAVVPPAVAAPVPAPPSPRPPAPAPAEPQQAVAPTRSVVVPVTVLNNSRRAGIAARAAERFERIGWPVRLTGNFTGRIRSTTVYYEPGQQASAQAFARDVEGIARVLPRFDGLPGEGLTIVLTREFPI